MALDLSKIIQHSFDRGQYYAQQTPKNQIVIHHTVSGEGVRNDIAHWARDPQRISTHVIIDRKGVIHQLYSSKFWSHHLGVKSRIFHEQGLRGISNNLELNQHSVSIELDSYGGLKKIGEKYYTVYGNTIPASKVHAYKKTYRGFDYYEKYTPQQLNALKDILEFWVKRYKISPKYSDKIWEVYKPALRGDSGIFTHTSYRSDKSDCHPQPELISTLKNLGKDIRIKIEVKAKSKPKAKAKPKTKTATKPKVNIKQIKPKVAAKVASKVASKAAVGKKPAAKKATKK